MKSNDLMEIKMAPETKYDPRDFVRFTEGTIRFNVAMMEDIWNRTNASYGKEAKVRALHKEMMDEFSKFLYHLLNR